MRSRFDEQLETLNNELITMGSLCETAISKAADALEKNDVALARQVRMSVGDINREERDIEGMCLRLIMQQQPVASDLRVISAALKMVTDMERIGDQAGDIAEIVEKQNLGAPFSVKSNIVEMAHETMKMVSLGVDSFVKKDFDTINKVIDYDNIVDKHFDEIKNLLIDKLQAGETNGEEALDLLMIAKYLERIGDHAENIGRWVRFSITGELEEEA
ncbi:MAG: phosphate signaling complex protein PhoU [Eubacterium sp.]|jgi:phosphate transport system protein